LTNQYFFEIFGNGALMAILLKNDLALMATRFGKIIKIKDNWGENLPKVAH
jgi:hypothetical protein